MHTAPFALLHHASRVLPVAVCGIIGPTVDCWSVNVLNSANADVQLIKRQ